MSHTDDAHNFREENDFFNYKFKVNMCHKKPGPRAQDGLIMI